MKLYSIAFILLTVLVIPSCDEAETVDTRNPSNLSVELTVAEDGSGTIDIVATADNTIEYYFDLDDEFVEDPILNTTGLLSHSYTQSGVYDVEVRSYGTSGSFLKDVKTITIVYSGDVVSLEDGYNTPLAYDGMTLVWQDEFSGSTLDTDTWTHEIGTGSNGWGNNELQYYTSQNTTVADGVLTIEAREENLQGKNYTSSRIITEGNESFSYGRIDIRALLPEGQGIWPAVWMLGSNFNTVGWPDCGEIDIMEMVGGSENKVHGTVHWDNNGYASFGGDYTLSDGIFSDEYHVFSIIWNSSSITWYVDDIQYHVISITPALLSEFHNEFFFIFNVAVGGNWPGSPDATTNFPQQMKVDYVRVFQED